MHHLPVPYAFPSLLSSDPQFLLTPSPLSHHPPHLPTHAQFLPFQTQPARSVCEQFVLMKFVFHISIWVILAYDKSKEREPLVVINVGNVALYSKGKYRFLLSKKKVKIKMSSC